MEQVKTINGNLKWYALSVMSNQEKSVKKNILREVDRNELDSVVTNIEIPMEKILSFKNGKKIIKEKITMPGYLLIEADLTYGEIMPILKRTTGVFGFISDSRGKDENSKPQPLRKNEVERLLNIEEDKDEDLLWTFATGDPVKILSGPFATFEGEITAINDEKKKMNVNVMIFGRETPVELDYTQVDKLFDNSTNTPS